MKAMRLFNMMLCQPPDERVFTVPVWSPDSQHIAYISEPLMVAEGIERVGGVGGGTLPSHLWLCGIGSDGSELTLIGDQPADASFMTENVPDKGVAHSIPVWSPDSTKIAWTELHYPQTDNWLAIYDLASGEITRVVIPAVAPAGIPAPLGALWGDYGIVIQWVEFAEDADFLPLVFAVFDSNGELMIQNLFQPQSSDEFPFRVIPLQNADRKLLALQFPMGRWELLNIETGEPEPLSRDLYMEVRHPTNPEGNSLVLVPDAGGSDRWYLVDAQDLILDTQGLPVLFDIHLRDWVALSGKGEVAAITDAVHVWRDGKIFEIPATREVAENFVGMSWGAEDWQPRFMMQNPALITPSNCTGFIASRLQIGGNGIVLPGDPNNIREEATSSSPVIGVIPAGATFAVIEGPVCADDLAWWNVNYEGTIGWTAEGVNSTYWLAPTE